MIKYTNYNNYLFDLPYQLTFYLLTFQPPFLFFLLFNHTASSIVINNSDCLSHITNNFDFSCFCRKKYFKIKTHRELSMIDYVSWAFKWIVDDINRSWVNGKIYSKLINDFARKIQRELSFTNNFFLFIYLFLSENKLYFYSILYYLIIYL